MEDAAAATAARYSSGRSASTFPSLHLGQQLRLTGSSSSASQQAAPVGWPVNDVWIAAGHSRVQVQQFLHRTRLPFRPGKIRSSRTDHVTRSTHCEMEIRKRMPGQEVPRACTTALTVYRDPSNLLDSHPIKGLPVQSALTACHQPET